MLFEQTILLEYFHTNGISQFFSYFVNIVGNVYYRNIIIESRCKCLFNKLTWKHRQFLKLNKTGCIYCLIVLIV